MLAGVARRFKVEEQVEAAFNMPSIDTRRIVDVLVRALMSVDPGRALKHLDVFRALCLLRAQDFDSVGLAHAWLQGYEADPAERTAPRLQDATARPRRGRARPVLDSVLDHGARQTSCSPGATRRARGFR